MRRAVFLVIVSFLLLPQAEAGGKDRSRAEMIRKEKNLEDIKRRIREEKRHVKKAAEKEISILGELERINIGLSGKREELRKADAALADAKRALDGAAFNISRLEGEKRALNERLRLRLKAMYKMRGYVQVSALTPVEPSGPDAGGAARMHRYMTALLDSDRGLIKSSEETLSRLDEERRRFLTLKAGLEAAREAAAVKKNEAEALKAEKTALLHGVKHEKQRGIKAVKELEEAAAELTELIGKLRTEREEAPAGAAKGFAAMKGRLPMPVDGRIISSYGRVRHPKFATVTFNNGVLIEAAEGRAVKCVYDGRVIYRGALKGYGNLVIIDHGGGFYTLLAHLSNILKERGDEVKKGDVVASVGESAMETSAGLYFEIRERGIPRDPAAWLAIR